MDKQRIAIVLGTGIGPSGGVRTMARFLYHTVADSGRYEPGLISVAASARDKTSVRLLSPDSWRRGIQVVNGCWQGLPFAHVGAFLGEAEFQRFRPRYVLTELLNEYDLIQVVAGTPAIAVSVTQANKPKCLFVATTIKQERASTMGQLRGLKKLWLYTMTHINSRIESHALSQMNHVFGESKYTLGLLSAAVPEPKLSLGVPGVDTSLFSPGGKYCEDGHILSVGRFTDPRKNVKLLLEAYRKLHAAGLDPPRLVLAGRDGLSVKDLSLVRQWGLKDDIDICQNVTAEELVNLYRQASLFVLPSNEEGLGIVILEAMASGLPVVSTRCGGPETAILDGETGYLTPVGDVTVLAKKIQDLLVNPPLRRRMGEAGRRVAQDRFSLKAAGQTYLEKYDQLLEEAQ